MMQMGGSPIPPTPQPPDGWEIVNYIGAQSGSTNLKDNVTSGELTYLKANVMFLRWYYASIVEGSDISTRFGGNANNNTISLNIVANGGTWASIFIGATSNYVDKLMELVYENNTLTVFFDGVEFTHINNLTNPVVQGGTWNILNYGSNRTIPFRIYGLEYDIASVHRKWIPVHNTHGGMTYPNTMFEIYTQTLMHENGTYPCNIYG